MKILLLKDIPKIGRKYEIKEVADGFARNKLFPGKLAEPATGDTARRIEKIQQEEAARGAVADMLLTKNLSILDGKTVEMHEKANDKGHLFAAIHESAIAAAIKKALHIDIPPEAIVLDKPIKELGEHALMAKVAGKSVKFVLRVA